MMSRNFIIFQVAGNCLFNIDDFLFLFFNLYLNINNINKFQFYIIFYLYI